MEGEGRAFCAGGDLQTIGAAAAADNIAPVVGELLKHYHAFIETMRRMPKIVLSSVHGSAAGAGMGLAFVADLCIAADDAQVHAGLRQDRRVTRWRQHGRHGRHCRHPPRAADIPCGG
jgi:enoyl-CoA hydratase/carnithine racemase